MAGDWGLAALLYDPLLGPLVNGFRRAGLEVAPSRPGLRVLDVGCGTGTFLGLYRDGGAATAGVDASRSMLARARDRLGPSIPLAAADAGRLPFGDGTFDLVLIMTVLHEMSGAAAAIAEAARVAGTEGRILVVDHHPGPAAGLRGRVFRAAAAGIERIAGRRHHRAFRGFLRRGGVPALAVEAGLRIERWLCPGSGTMGIYLLRRA